MTKVKFVGIDDWNRPIFKDDKKNYYGSTDILFDYDETEGNVLERVEAKDLTFFGNHFGCEPMGIPYDVQIIKQEDNF